GPTGSVTDTVIVSDNYSHSVSTMVTVTPGVSIAPATANVIYGAPRNFSATGGSGTGYQFSISPNNSGGTIGASSGFYTPGPRGGVTDTGAGRDSLLHAASAMGVV